MMTRFLIIAMLLLTNITFAQMTPQSTIENFFKAFHVRDTVALRMTMSDKIVFHSIAQSNSGAKLSMESGAEFIQSIGSIPAALKLEERILSWNIQIDGALANVWTPYEFYVDGKLSHTGVNSFQLFNDKDGWKIVHCIDTRRR